MKIAEVEVGQTPEQARLRTMKQGIARQKVALAAEKERQHDAKHAQKMTKLRAQATSS
jgi:hypothetical protein